MLRFDKMTVKAQEALQESQEIAARHEQQEIAPLHLLSALVAQADGVVPSLDPPGRSHGSAGRRN